MGGGVFFAWIIFLVLMAFGIALALLGLLFFVLPLVTGMVHWPDVTRGLGTIFSLDVKKIGAMGSEGLSAAGIVLGLGGAVLVLVFGALTNLLKRTGTRAITVQPLAPVSAGGFIITAEGVYTRQVKNILPGSTCYRLHSWRSLTLDRVNEKAGYVGLADGSALLMLRAKERGAKGAEDFARMKQTIQSNLSAAAMAPPAEGKKKAAAPRRRGGFRWVVAAAMVAVILVGDLIAASSLDRVSKGKAGDQACDVDGRSLAASTTFTIMVPDIAAMALQYNPSMPYGQSGMPYSPPITPYKPITTVIPTFPRPRPFLIIKDGKIVREYCETHGLLYATIHPIAAASATMPALRATLKEKGFGEAMLQYGGNIDAFCIWFMVAAVVIGVAAPKVYAYRQ